MQISETESEISCKAREHWRADGLPLLVGAAIYLAIVCGLLAFAYFGARLPSFRDNWFFGNLVLPIFALLLVTSPFWIVATVIWVSIYWEDMVEWWKIRLTYPRTGYVAPPSYWKEEEVAPSTPKSRVERVLDALGSFWFWLLMLSLLKALLGPRTNARTLILLAAFSRFGAFALPFIPTTVVPSDAQPRRRELLLLLARY